MFGGLAWRSPVPGLSLIAEASSDDYSLERARGTFRPRTRMNYGLSYAATENVTLGLNWLYGQAVGGSVSFQLNPAQPGPVDRLGPAPPAPVIRSPEEQQNALLVLLNQREDNARLARKIERIQGKNAFVDTLADSADLADVHVDGLTLSLKVKSGPGAQLCRMAANAIRPSGIDIGDIVVDAGGIPARCAVPRPAGLQNAAYPGVDASPEETLVKAPFLIDATKEADMATAAFRANAKKQHLAIDAVSFSESEATVYYTNGRYQSEADAVNRLTRVLMADAPPTIEKFRLIAVHDGVPQREFNVLRAPVERIMTQSGENASVFGGPMTIQSPPLDNPVLSEAEQDNYPSFAWSVFPKFRQQLFDPSNGLGAQLVGAARGSIDLAPGLSLWGEAEVSLLDNFTVNRHNDSVLPHVRTDFGRYFTEGRHGLDALQVNYRFRLAPDVFATARAGYLESMFAGVGGEVLWKPDLQRWAIGADLYEVKQRDFDRLFGLRPYHELTGHVTVYYTSPWYDLDFELRAGRYLAGDHGVTLQVSLTPLLQRYRNRRLLHQNRCLRRAVRRRPVRQGDNHPHTDRLGSADRDAERGRDGFAPRATRRRPGFAGRCHAL